LCNSYQKKKSRYFCLNVGQSIKIYSLEEGTEYLVQVRQIKIQSDWILLEAETDLCAEEPNKGLTNDGRGYIQLGLSAAPLSLSKGVISSSRLNIFGHVLGSSGANTGDSLIGMNIGCIKIGYNIKENVSSRSSSRAHIIPVSNFQYID
jgi:hypothetical protein